MKVKGVDLLTIHKNKYDDERGCHVFCLFGFVNIEFDSFPAANLSVSSSQVLDSLHVSP